MNVLPRGVISRFQMIILEKLTSGVTLTSLHFDFKLVNELMDAIQLFTSMSVHIGVQLPHVGRYLDEGM